jgi:hypothetical protein
MAPIPQVQSIKNSDAPHHLDEGESYGDSAGTGTRIDDFGGEVETSRPIDDRDISTLRAMKEYMGSHPSGGLRGLVKEFGGTAALLYEAALIQADKNAGRITSDVEEEKKYDEAGIKIGRIEDELLRGGQTIYSATDGQYYTRANVPRSGSRDAGDAQE